MPLTNIHSLAPEPVKRGTQHRLPDALSRDALVSCVRPCSPPSLPRRGKKKGKTTTEGLLTCIHSLARERRVSHAVQPLDGSTVEGHGQHAQRAAGWDGAVAAEHKAGVSGDAG